MTSRKRDDLSVFVGNIAYDTTEDQLVKIFSQVGQVASLRLKFDRETGKPLGFGFVEYHDAEAAASARRNLNNFEINGRRLRVDVPSQTGKGAGAGAGGGGGGKSDGGQKRARTDNQQSSLAGGESVAGVVSNMTPQQVYQIVAQMKAMVDATPDQAKALLASNPQLCTAVLQAQILLGMAPQLVALAREKNNQMAEHSQMQRARLQQQGHLPAYSDQALADAFGSLDENARATLIGVLNLEPAQIGAMAPEEQQNILMLRQKAIDLLEGK